MCETRAQTKKKRNYMHKRVSSRCAFCFFSTPPMNKHGTHTSTHTTQKKKHCARKANMHTPKHATRNYTTQFLHKLYVLCCVVCPRVCFACVLVMSVPCINTRPNTHRNVYVNFGRVSVQLLMVCVCVLCAMLLFCSLHIWVVLLKCDGYSSARDTVSIRGTRPAHTHNKP